MLSNSHRWGQASALLSHPPTLIVYGGKTASGYSYNSAPNTNDLLALDLTSNFSVSAPPWRLLSSSLPLNAAPAVSFHSLTTLVDLGTLSVSTLLLFGGDDTAVPLPAGNDSFYAFSLPSPFSTSSALPPSFFSNDFAAAPSQPMRRIRHASVAVSDGTTVRQWILGGLKNDGSGIALAEFWLYSYSLATKTASWTLLAGLANAPPALYDHTLTLLISGGTVSLFVIGGVAPGISPTSLSALSTIYKFTPSSSASDGGAWSQMTAAGTLPKDRRAHVAVALDDHRILIHGGASGDLSNVYGDMAILDTTGGSTVTWSPVYSPSGTAPAARYDHLAVWTGDSMLLSDGKGSTCYLTIILHGAFLQGTVPMVASLPISACITPPPTPGSPPIRLRPHLTPRRAIPRIAPVLFLHLRPPIHFPYLVSPRR